MTQIQRAITYELDISEHSRSRTIKLTLTDAAALIEIDDPDDPDDPDNAVEMSLDTTISEQLADLFQLARAHCRTIETEFEEPTA